MFRCSSPPDGVVPRTVLAGGASGGARRGADWVFGGFFFPCAEVHDGHDGAAEAEDRLLRADGGTVEEGRLLRADDGAVEGRLLRADEAPSSDRGVFCPWACLRVRARAVADGPLLLVSDSTRRITELTVPPARGMAASGPLGLRRRRSRLVSVWRSLCPSCLALSSRRLRAATTALAKGWFSMLAMAFGSSSNQGGGCACAGGET